MLFYKTILTIVILWMVGCFIVGWIFPQPDVIDVKYARVLAGAFLVIIVFLTISLIKERRMYVGKSEGSKKGG
jgi:hypothetical protein